MFRESSHLDKLGTGLAIQGGINYGCSTMLPALHIPGALLLGDTHSLPMCAPGGRRSGLQDVPIGNSVPPLKALHAGLLALLAHIGVPDPFIERGHARSYSGYCQSAFVLLSLRHYGSSYVGYNFGLRSL